MSCDSEGDVRYLFKRLAFHALWWEMAGDCTNLGKVVPETLLMFMWPDRLAKHGFLSFKVTAKYKDVFCCKNTLMRSQGRCGLLPSGPAGAVWYLYHTASSPCGDVSIFTPQGGQRSGSDIACNAWSQSGFSVSLGDTLAGQMLVVTRVPTSFVQLKDIFCNL